MTGRLITVALLIIRPMCAILAKEMADFYARISKKTVLMGILRQNDNPRKRTD